MIRWILHYNHYNIWHSVLSQGFMVRMIFYLCDFLDWKLPRKAEVSHTKASHEKENVITKTSKEDSTTKVIGPSKDATPEVLLISEEWKTWETGSSHSLVVTSRILWYIPTYIKGGTDALVGHEFNFNRDDLFKDIDANVIVSRN